VSLVDPVGVKRHVAVQDSNNAYLRPDPGAQVGNWPTFTSVPIQR